MMRKRIRLARGFTLVELMVSLVAGLIIAMAAVGLAKTASTTFYEQARLMSVESTTRSAAERLRADLGRVSYMSTGNIRLARNDSATVPFGQKISHSVGGSTSRYGAVTANLSGIRIRSGASRTNAVISTAGAEGANALSTNNGLKPDAIEITGNLTSDDSYQATWLGSGTDGACGGPHLTMKRDADAAVRRLLNASDPDKAVKAVFRPVAANAVDYLARIVDMRGCQHYVPVCDAGGDATSAFIDLRADATGAAILSTVQDGSTCGGNIGEMFTVSPVHHVRWYIGPNTDARLATDTIVDATDNKFNLYREMLDANYAPLPNATPEIVAEYAIDLKFGIVVENPGPPVSLDVLDLDSDNGGGNVDKWTGAASAATSNPQRVRSVRFRIAVRAAVPDRTANLIVPPGAPYLSRYCLENATPANCKKFARVRTLVSEVALTNQAGMKY